MARIPAAHSEPCLLSSWARKSAMTAKYTSSMPKSCHFLQLVPNHILHVIEREHPCSHASDFSRSLPYLLVFYPYFILFYLNFALGNTLILTDILVHEAYLELKAAIVYITFL